MPATSRQHSWPSLIAIFLIPLVFAAAISRLVLNFQRATTSVNEPKVAMLIGTTARYKLDSKESDEEYDSLLPSGGHLIHILGESGIAEEYTVTMFHQLKCLDIIRREYIRDSSRDVSPLAQHCVNYLHQSLLCNLNTGLESTKNVFATASRSYRALCYDWTAIYEHAERNYQDHIVQ